jgi:DNA-binding transcriptional MerR regulator
MADLFMFRGVEFDLGYADFHASENNLGLIRKLNHKNRQLPSREFTYRIINHWEANKLLTSSRRNNTGWRKYSVMDMVWVYIIKELRLFGFSLEQIVKVKKNLTEKKDRPESVFPVLEYYISLCLYNKPAYLLIFPHGEVHALSEKEYQLNRELNSAPTYIVIKLNSIIQKIMTGANLKPNYKQDYILSSDEKKAVMLIRLGNVEEVTFVRENGESNVVEAGTNGNESPSEEIIKMIVERNYDSATIKHGAGKYYHFKRKQSTPKAPKQYQAGLFD